MVLEEDKRATNVRNGLVFAFYFLKHNALSFKKCPGENSDKLSKRVENCEKVPKRCCPLVVAL